MSMIINIADVCDCPEMPVNRWTMPDGATQDRSISAGSGVNDAEDYAISGAVRWQIVCPDCGQVFIEGD